MGGTETFSYEFFIIRMGESFIVKSLVLGDCEQDSEVCRQEQELMALLSPVAIWERLQASGSSWGSGGYNLQEWSCLGNWG